MANQLLFHIPQDDTGVEVIGLSWKVPGDIGEVLPGASPLLICPRHGAYEDFDFHADGCLVCIESAPARWEIEDDEEGPGYE